MSIQDTGAQAPASPGGEDMSRLEALGSMTAEVDQANPTPEQQAEQEAEAVAMTESEAAAKSWGMIMFTVGGMATMIAPELRPLYSQERCFEWGQAANAVAEKHGLKGPGNMPEITLLASTLTFAVPTFFAVREKLADARDGKGPATWVSKVGLWWRTRKARKQAAAMAKAGITEPDQHQPGEQDGR
jgi:hypothetical protein